MALYEGLCTNCGSLLRVDDSQESVRCIFCWGESDSEAAINLMNKNDIEYPNEAYAEPSAEEKAEALKAQGMGGVVMRQEPKVKRKEKKTGKLTPKEKVALQNKPLVKPEVSKKHKIAILAGVAAFVIALAAIGLPIYFLRENKADEIMQKLPEHVALSNAKEKVDLHRQDNHIITIVSPETVTQEQAEETFLAFSKVYSEVYGISEEDAKNKVELKLLDNYTGGFRVKVKDGSITSTSLEKVKN